MCGCVFLTDAPSKHTLASARSLGQKGISVDVGSKSIHPLAAFSKYVNETFTYPDVEEHPAAFIEAMIKLCQKKRYDVLMPIGHEATLPLSEKKEKFKSITRIPVADYDKITIASRKDKITQFAAQLGIPTPKTIDLRNQRLEEACVLGYPLVVKPVIGSGRLHYANSKEELRQTSLDIVKASGHKPIIQEYIKGEAFGFEALYNHGKPKAIFMHRRLREHPLTGGPSTFAESIYDVKLRDYGLRLLNELNWHGLAMVEFKKSINDGQFRLLEINTKFWGSLDLSVASGVDFPFLLYKMTMDGDIKSHFAYRQGVRFMWPFPHDFIRSMSKPSDLKDFVKDLTDVRVKKNIELNDMRPLAIQLAQTAELTLRLIKAPFKLRYPHGIPSDAPL